MLEPKQLFFLRKANGEENKIESEMTQGPEANLNKEPERQRKRLTSAETRARGRSRTYDIGLVYISAA